MSDDQAREALLEVAQELDRMRALMDAPDVAPGIRAASCTR